MGKVAMLVLLLLVMRHPELFVSASSVQEKSHTLDEYVTLFKELFTGLVAFHSDPNMDHIAGLRKLADKSEELATKAAQAAIFVTSEIYEAELSARKTLLEPLIAVLDRMEYTDVRVRDFVSLRAFNGSNFNGVPGVQLFMEDAQIALGERYSGLKSWIEDIREHTNVSENRFLIRFCTSLVQFGTTTCMLQVHGSIFGSNCSARYSSVCHFEGTYFDTDNKWEAPTAVYGCVNERIARLSKNETTLNRLAMYARRNVFLAFNFIAFCSALNETYDGINPDSVRIVRSIADGFALSQKEIDSSSWPGLAKAATARTLASSALKLPVDEADQTYNQTAREIVNELEYTWFSHGYSAVVYYSFAGPLKSDVLFYNGSEKDSFDEATGSTKAFVKRYTREEADSAKKLWKSVELTPIHKKDRRLRDDAPSTSMTERFRKAKLDAKLFGDSGFRAAVVIPCVYRFVWYELAWQYFHAFGTTSPCVLTFRGKNAYKPCGAVVVLP